MSKDNNDFHLQSNTLPPCSQTCSNSSRARPSRPSSGNRILHGTLSSPSSSLSKVAHRRRNLSSQQHARSRKSAYSTANRTTLRSSIIISFTTQSSYVAAFLDFVFHADLTSNKDDYETAKQIVMKAMQQIDLIVPGASGVPSLTESRGKTHYHHLSIQPLSADLEIATFLILFCDNESTDFQIFWKNHTRVLPRLSQIARQYNAIPAASVYLEQVFSVTGAIKNIRQASMSSVTLRSLMILRKKKNIEKLRSFSLP
ncbi:unnamed protein product [Rotaria socialis]|uniref:HAT C-terminal dimerisation domain-containing protein n=1 Tax=Rotaria socialis TaxID=392032 RepID=A0A820VJR2_9BILA|nr:unnamed protein product [Rotaria socialis]